MSPNGKAALRARPSDTAAPQAGPDSAALQGVPDCCPGSPQDRQRGAGLLGTSAGLLVFLLLMLAAVQILFNLYATSMVTSAAQQAASSVASFAAADDRCAAVPAAEAAMRDSLGDYAAVAGLTLSWACAGPDSVRLRVQAEHPTLLPSRMAGLSRLVRLDRTITVRLEAPR